MSFPSSTVFKNVDHLDTALPTTNDSALNAIDGNLLPILRGDNRPDLLRAETLADILEATAERLPHKIALRFGEKSLTYSELNYCANRVASQLLTAGIGHGQIVGLWCSRGIDLLVMQAGITKSGAAWLPFDADTPIHRLRECLEDCRASALLSCDALADGLSDTDLCSLPPVWRAENVLSATLSAAAIQRIPDPSAAAYLIYTSGSTGKPKGIAISQRSICHFLRSENSVLGVREDDLVYQGFSVAFDMSFEEIWISYLAGATLLIAPPLLAVDPEALPKALRDEQVTVLHAVPTLLSLFEEDIPSLRIVNLGGEACPAHIAEKWSRPGRILFNTYGPTEATVSASVAILTPGQTVHIGRPLPNYDMFVIDPDTTTGIRLLPYGEVGELCIAGIGMAIGYAGRPDLTADKFLPLPWSKAAGQDEKFYRTGDLARIELNGQISCLGRSDDQVKIRGFRVELGEIERRLATLPGIGAAAVVLRSEAGVDTLIAFTVVGGATNAATQTLPLAPNPALWRAALALTLPSYMVPARFEVLEHMPRLLSGKIDRNRLKALPLSIAIAPAEGEQPQGEAQTVLFAALNTLFPGQALRLDSDFFNDFGGHSLLAARLVSSLRAHVPFAGFRIAHIYELRTVGAIAAELERVAADAAGDTPQCEWTAPSTVDRWICGTAQACVLPLLLTIRMAQWLTPFFVYNYFTGDPGDSVARAIGFSMVSFLALVLANFSIAIGVKWTIGGRFKAGRYPLWGATYFRWWLVDRIVEAAPTYLLAGSTLQSWWLRALGAKVGRHVMIGSISLRAPDLLIIGDGVSIGNAVGLENARVEHGQLHLGTIVLGADSCIGSYTILEPNVIVEPRGHLEGQSALSSNVTLPAGRIWRGSPARDAGAFDIDSLPPRPSISKRRLALQNVYFAVAGLGMASVFFLPVFPSFMLIDWFDNADRFPWLETGTVSLQLLKYFVLACPAAALLIVLTALISATIRRLALPNLRSGRWSVYSRLYCAKWLVNQIQESSLQVLYGVYATVFSASWYRLLGARVGKGAEISTVLGVVPAMLTLGDDTFIADAVMLGDEQIDGGWMRIQPTVVGRRAFVGNGAYVADGTVLPENTLIGVLSTAPDNARMHPGETWVGSPPVHLPAREIVTGFAESLTYRPSNARRLARSLIEAARIVIPHALVTAVGYTVILDLMPLAGDGRWAALIGDLLLAGTLYGFGTFVLVAALKWLLIGRYRRNSVPMWTSFVWLSEAVTNLYEGMVIPNFMRYLRGTPWLPLAFNLLGAKIGRGVYMDTTDITEFDCVAIGDHCEINALCCPQTHLFEDRVMKIDRVDIGDWVHMGARSTVLYGAKVGHHARLGAMTLVMKGEFIPPASHWHGSPATLVRSN